jgi:uncharacterized membrane protein
LFEEGDIMAIANYRTKYVNLSKAERWASVIGGGLLLFYGLKRRSPARFSLALLGGKLLYRGITGHSHVYDALRINTSDEPKRAAVSVPYGSGIRVERSIRIDKSPAELYRFWRNFENLPRFMKHIQSVKILDDKRSHWVAKGSTETTVEWDAEIINEIENQLIGWRSREPTKVDHAGSVHFEEALGGCGTEVKVEIEYHPPGGAITATIAKLFGEEPGKQIEEDLCRFKQLMETGEVPTTEEQLAGAAAKMGGQVTEKRYPNRPKDIVQEASEESFPASDPPSWTARRAGSSS